MGETKVEPITDNLELTADNFAVHITCSSFSMLRRKIAREFGIYDIDAFWGGEVVPNISPAMLNFLTHPDHEGELDWQSCAQIYEELLPFENAWKESFTSCDSNPVFTPLMEVIAGVIASVIQESLRDLLAVLKVSATKQTNLVFN